MASVREAKVLPIKPYRYDAERQGSDLSRHSETSPKVTPVASRITVFPGQNMHPFRTTKGDAMKDAPMTASDAQRQQGRLELTLDRIETLLEQQQVALQKDYARFGLMLGSSLVGAGIALMVAGIPFAFSLTSMVWGSIVATVSLFLRHCGRGRQIEHTRLLVGMHESTARITQRTELLRRMWSEGLPTNCSVGDLLVLLDAQLNRTARQ